MLDADMELWGMRWLPALREFEGFLARWEPALGVPATNESSRGQDPIAVTYVDHIFVAVHAEAAPLLLPYDTSLDRPCNWASQWYLTVLASALFRNHVLMLPSMRGANPVHANYSRFDCLANFGGLSSRLRSKLPNRTRNCILP